MLPFHRRGATSVASVILMLMAGASAQAAVIEFGDRDVLGTGSYPGDPTAGATLDGLAVGVVTFGASELNHSFPFSPEGDDFPGTDQIFVGSAQTGFQDGYSQFNGRQAGPQVLSLNYGSLVGPGESVQTLTLGIAFDDFQFQVFGQPYTVKINGVAHAGLTALANSLEQTFPQVQFASIGLEPSLLSGSNVLTLEIDQGGNGGDGWAIDFLTVGVTVPATSSAGAVGLIALGGLRRKRRA